MNHPLAGEDLNFEIELVRNSKVKKLFNLLIKCVLTRTLLVDGNSLLNTGFHGIKNMYNGVDHIGGLYHFLNTLRKHIDSYLITKVVVFWDGKETLHIPVLNYIQIIS